MKHKPQMKNIRKRIWEKKNKNSLKIQIKKFIVKNVHNKRKGKTDIGVFVTKLQNIK